MLITKQQLGAHRLATKDEERFNLQHLQIRPDGAVGATNGHIMVIVQSRDLPKEDAIPHVPNQRGGEPEGTVYLHAAAAVHAGRIVPTNSEQPGFGLARLTVEAGGRISLGAVDEATPQLVLHEQPEGDLNYPNLEVVVPKDEPALSLTLSAEYLVMIGQYAKTFALGKKAAVRLTLWGPHQGVMFAFEDDRHTVRGVVMPMRDEKAEKAAERPGAGAVGVTVDDGAGVVARIDIDMDRACSACGGKGATQGGLCLSCLTEQMTERLAAP